MLGPRAKKLPIITQVSCLLILTLSACTVRSDYERLSQKVTLAAVQLQEQKEDTRDAVQEAAEAQQVALNQEQFKFRSDQTAAFIEKWKQAEFEVNQLDLRLGAAVEEYYAFFDFQLTQANNISDPSIRDATLAYVQSNYDKFSGQIGITQSGIQKLTEDIALGNDIIQSLQIVGEVNLVMERISEMRPLGPEALAQIELIDDLVQEGKQLLNLELNENLFVVPTPASGD